MMLMRDPPDHTRLRGLVTKVFTARKIEEMRPGIQAIIDRLLDKVVDAGEMDAIRDLSSPLVLAICELLGILRRTVCAETATASWQPRC